MTYSYQPKKIKRIMPLHDAVLVCDMNFEHRVTAAGLILPSDDGKNSGIRPRWGRVYAIGPKQKDVKVGQWILVAHGRWTRGLTIVDSSGTERTIRKVDLNDILAISDEEVKDETMSDKVI